MEYYKVIYTSDLGIGYYICTALSKDEANKKWLSFKEEYEAYKPKLSVFWAGTLEEQEALTSGVTSGKIKNEK